MRESEPPSTGLAETILREIDQHLSMLASHGTPAAIDLLSLPMTAADRGELEQRLGRGEVEALLTAAGNSEVWETGYAGVWWIRHFGVGERVAAERIEIASLPGIFLADSADIAAAAARLRDELAPDGRSQENGAVHA